MLRSMLMYRRRGPGDVDVILDGAAAGGLYKYPEEGMTEWASDAMLNETLGLGKDGVHGSLRECKAALAKAQLARAAPHSHNPKPAMGD